MEQQIRSCPRCSGANAVRLRSTGSPVFRCPRCGLIFSPATPSPLSVRPERRKQVVYPAAKLDVQPAPEVEGQVPHLRDETRNPKLDSYENATSATTHGSHQMCPSYDVAPLSAPQTTQNRPQNYSSQIGDATTKSKLNSYDHATNATIISYEQNVFSYDSGRTLAGPPAPTSTSADRG